MDGEQKSKKKLDEIGQGMDRYILQLCNGQSTGPSPVRTKSFDYSIHQKKKKED